MVQARIINVFYRHLLGCQHQDKEVLNMTKDVQMSIKVESQLRDVFTAISVSQLFEQLGI